MKCTWKDWKGGGLTSWHGISHRDGTDWGISSMKDLGHGTVEASPLCCCECSPDTGTPILMWMWNPGQPLVLCHSWDGGACQSQSHLLVICTMEIILGELNPHKVSACPFEGRSAVDPSSLEIWGRKNHPGVQSHRTGLSMGKIPVTGFTESKELEWFHLFLPKFSFLASLPLHDLAELRHCVLLPCTICKVKIYGN